MLDDLRKNALRQKKMDALTAKHLHQYRLTVLNRLNFIVDVLAISVPILLLTVRFLVKGTTLGSIIEPFNEILASILLIFAVVKIIGRWQELAENHGRLIGENISMVGQIEHLLNYAMVVSLDSAQGMLALTESIEKADRYALGCIKENERQFAFREALKEFTPGTTEVCSECGASPWHFEPGSCQLCGNTPV